MKGFFALFKKSFEEMFTGGIGKSLLNLVICAMLIALSVVIESMAIDIGAVRINFAFLAVAAIGMLFGPTVGLVSGGICDV
ncbi:MAG: ECF transporter S component, partial [Oscillospiraceae bacterium]|nr:ECF transporter S component [Oscillospiraceae bacterium]